jgi:transposase
MTKKDLNNWIMYHELHRFKRLGFSNTKIAQFLVIDARTVGKYLNMSEDEYEHRLLQSCQRKKVLSLYESFVFEKLSLFQDTSTAQIHDWLKEAHVDFPEISPRTVYNFVMFVRQKYNIPFVRTTREYFPIEELPYGEQAQVDFGEYNMRTPSGQKKKVKFFAMVLSRSRMKYIWFLDKPFTSQTVSQAHENAFAFFGGIPKTLVYDQDRTMVVDENLGDIILTSTFKQYTKSRSFNLHFCRKADPESKGKVENVVQYVKKNFLYNRLYSDIQTLNDEAIAWLDRTANYLPHNLTKICPKNAFIDEKSHLRPFTPLTIENNENKTHIVRKNNTVNYKSNFYTVPMGTYKAEETIVILKENENTLEIYSIGNELICTHTLSLETGKIISNTNHKRDTSKTLEDMMQQVAAHFADQDLAMSYLQQIRKKLPRYTRDHLQVISKALTDVDKETADKTLNFCLKNSVLNGNEWTQVLQVFLDESLTKINKNEIILLDKNNAKKANQTPQASNIDDYENIINPVCR